MLNSFTRLPPRWRQTGFNPPQHHPPKHLKKVFIGSLVSVLVAGAAACAAFAAENPAAPENAHVTLTVIRFRGLWSSTDNGYVDAMTDLAPHAAVTLVDQGGMPTLRVKHAVDIEIAVDSADPAESYTPLDVFFQERADRPDVKLDPDGRINFAQWLSNNDTVVINNRFVQKGRDGRYEFFVVVRRDSDGESVSSILTSIIQIDRRG